MSGWFDFHLHFFSRAYFEALAAQSPDPGPVAEKLAELARRAGVEIPPPDVGTHTARWLSEMDRHGVEHACAFASAPEEVPALAEAARHARGRITPFALVDPRAAGAAERVGGLVREQGFKGVLLFPALHHYRIVAPECAPLWRELDRAGAIAYVHCGMFVVKVRDLLGFPRSADPSFANPLDLIAVANAYPRARFVIPHFGAGFFRETLLAGGHCPNVYVDSSSSNAWIATQGPKLRLRDVFERALGVFGPERILFGTDSTTFPQGWRADRLEEQIKLLEGLALPRREIDLILSGNARRLLAS
jgi:hypothetical protein